MSYWRSRHLIAAKALAQKDWAHPTVLSAVRKMGHERATVEQIRDVFWPSLSARSAQRRLKKLNIPYGCKCRTVARGDLTSLPPKNQHVDFANYRPLQRNWRSYMSRTPVFTCIECGDEAEQSKRGIKRTRCPKCRETHAKQYYADYYVNTLKPKRRAAKEVPELA